MTATLANGSPTRHRVPVSRISHEADRLFLPHDEPHSFVLDITPKVAARLLEKNRRNRPLSKARVAVLAAALRSGKWTLNAESVKVDRNGELLDGQHRLAACVEAGVAFETFVAVGLAPETFTTIDTGMRRRAADVLAISGRVNSIKLATAANLLLRYRSGSMDRSAVDFATILSVVEENPELETSVRFTLALPSFVNHGSAAVAHLLFDTIDPTLSELFFDQLKTGAGLVSGDPVLALRARLIGSPKNAKIRAQQVEQLALLIKAWNLVRAGKTAKILQCRAGGDTPEPFPVAR